VIIIPSKLFYKLSRVKQEQLLSKAVEIFSEKVYDELSIKEIVKRAGLSVGSFYRYFGSKEELYIYLVDREAEKFHVQTIGANTDPRYRLSIADVIRLFPEQKNFWLMFYRSSLEIRRKYYFRTYDNPIYQRLIHSLRSFLPEGIVSDSKIGAASFLLLILGYIVTAHHMLTGESYDEDEMQAFLQSAILKGLESAAQ
jgi:AcrR family transcriptional regulator